MRPITFNSILAKPISHLIELRQITGSDYASQVRLLFYFDRYLLERGFFKEPLTRSVIEDYEKTLSHLAPRSRSNRLCVVKQLCEYLSLNEPLTYRPELPRVPTSREAFIPYIYSQSEIHGLLMAAAKLPPQGSLRGPTIQTLLGLLYSTGIRISEAMSLNLADFYPNEARLFIAKGKFRKARWVPINHSTCEAVSRYVARRRRTKPHSPDSPLLLNLRQRRLHHSTVTYIFTALLQQCGLIRGSHKPRLHDLRHTFAIHRLLDWYQDGDDLNAKLVWLSTYMGHVSPYSTQVYIRPTVALLAQVNERFYRHYQQQVCRQDSSMTGESL